MDLDLPVTLTQGDRVSIPIAAYNYSGRSGRVSLHLQPEDWFSLDGDSLGKTVSVESGGVGTSQFTVTANRIGKFKLTLSARMDGGGSEAREDVVVREIEVIPNGREQDKMCIRDRSTPSLFRAPWNRWTSRATVSKTWKRAPFSPPPR